MAVPDNLKGVLLISPHKKPTFNVHHHDNWYQRKIKKKMNLQMLKTSESPFTHAPFLSPTV